MASVTDQDKMAAPIAQDYGARGHTYASILETIGNTPLVHLPRLSREQGCNAELLGNPNPVTLVISGAADELLVAVSVASIEGGAGRVMIRLS